MPLRRAIWGLQLEVHLAFLAKSLVYHTTHPWVLILFLPIWEPIFETIINSVSLSLLLDSVPSPGTLLSWWLASIPGAFILFPVASGQPGQPLLPLCPPRALPLRCPHLRENIKTYYLVFCPLTKSFYSFHNEVSLTKMQNVIIVEDKCGPLWLHTFLRNVINHFIPLQSYHVGRGQPTKKVFEKF